MRKFAELPAFDEEAIDRFWDHPGMRTNVECWLVNGQTSGYQTFTFRRKAYYRHRISYLLTYGRIPKNLLVLHRCNNKGCWNPAHLYAGTDADNSRDYREMASG